MATKKSRQVPSVERQIALALAGVLEDIKAIPSDIPTESVIEVLGKSAASAQKVMELNGYGGLESIASLVTAITEQISAAVSMGDGKALAQLGPALERAKKGLPPRLSTEKKTTKPPTERKPRKKKGEIGELTQEDLAGPNPPAED